MKNGIYILTALLITFNVSGQGFIRGKIFDGDTGEGLFGATVSKPGTTIGAVADFDGNYSLTLEAGIHTISFQFISYQTQLVSDIEIKEGVVTTLDITLLSATTELEEILVTADRAMDTEGALLVVQRKSPNLLDGISAQTFRKMGDSDLGVAMKRVTGVSVQGGKYIYVRGLGDRYTKTTLNGLNIPGLDPDNNSVQIDIFPTNTIENVIVYKTFSPDLTGDFTGGLVDVETKSFPDLKTTQFSIGFGYNPKMNLRNDFLTYDRSSTDFLGFDNGDRKLPFDKDAVIPDVVSPEGAQVERFTRSFSPQMAVQQGNSFMNYNFSFNHGNQINKGELTIGYNAVLTYRNTYEFFEDVEFGEYFKPSDFSESDLEGDEVRSGQLGNLDVSWSGLFSGAVKFDKHSFHASVLKSQNGVSSASNRKTVNLFDNPSVLEDDILTYTQRSVTNTILVGKHAFEKFDLEWRTSLNYSRIYEPDFRSTRIHLKDDGTYDLQVGVGAGIDRFYRDLNEDNKNFKIDLTYPFGERNKIKFGGAGTFKQRDFEVLEYFFRLRGAVTVTGDPDDFLKPENIWNPTDNKGTYVRGNFDPSKTFDSKQQVIGGYAMTEMQLLPKLKGIYGVRMEDVKMTYKGADQNFNEVDTISLDQLDVLPSINLVYSLTDVMNIRVSANRTLARPSFREKSNAQIYDPISKRTFIGNLDLQETHINNFDLRWEYFFAREEMISLSLFYKQFDGHIEVVSFETNPDNLKPRNSGSSTVTGLEMEFRKKLNEHFSFGSNVSFVKSAVDLKSVYVNDLGKTEYELRQENARTDEDIKSTRFMAGQSPYLINAFVGYQSEKLGLNTNLAYNVQGETLSIVGSGRVPDIYTRPFNSLNFNVTKSFGEQEKSMIRLTFVNLLGAAKEQFYKSHEADSKVFSIFRPGRTVNLTYSYRF